MYTRSHVNANTQVGTHTHTHTPLHTHRLQTLGVSQLLQGHTTAIHHARKCTHRLQTVELPCTLPDTPPAPSTTTSCPPPQLSARRPLLLVAAYWERAACWVTNPASSAQCWEGGAGVYCICVCLLNRPKKCIPGSLASFHLLLGLEGFVF